MSSQPNSPRPGQDHTPAHPSGLRQTYTASSSSSVSDTAGQASSTRRDAGPSNRHGAGPSRQHATESTSLLGATLDFREEAHEGPCNHGTFSPRPASPSGSLPGDWLSPSESETEASVPGIDGTVSEGSRRRSWKRRWASKMRSKKMSTSSALAEQHGVKDSALM